MMNANNPSPAPVFARAAVVVTICFAVGIVLPGGGPFQGFGKERGKKKKERVVEIEFTRSGGFAALATQVSGKVTFGGAGAAEVTSARNSYKRSLAGGEQSRLAADAEAAVAAKKQAAKNQGVDDGPGELRDGYQYDISITVQNGGTVQLTLHGESAPASFEPLAAWVRDECQKIWEH